MDTIDWNIFNMLKFQIKNIHIIVIVYITALVFTWILRAIVGADFHDDAHLFPILYVIGVTKYLMDNYKKRVDNSESEVFYIFVSNIISLILYFLTSHLLGYQNFLGAM